MAAAKNISIEETVEIARKCWFKFKKVSILALYTPFVVCLASGTLKIETLQHFIAQNSYYLKAFAKGYEAAIECTDDDDAKVGLSEMRKNVMKELEMQDTVIQEWDSDMVKKCALNPGTVKYTDFLLATTSGKIEGVKTATLATPFERTKLAAYILGAMVPGIRLYAYLGKELLVFLAGETTHPYKRIIENYASEGFEGLALQNESWLDKLSVSLTGEELDIIEKLYQQAMKLELGFLLAQPLDQKSVIPISREHNPSEERLVIFFNFDMTCTAVDSSAILAEIAIISAPKSGENEPENELVRLSSADLRSTWEDLSKQYTEEYEQCIDTMLLGEKAENFDYERLHKALEQLSDFEKRANTRVSESGVLKGLNLEDIKRAGERMILRDGCNNFFHSIIKNEQLNADIHVLSYCWCGDLIRSAFSSGVLDVLNVHANEFIFEENLSTGEIVKKVESPIDKIQAFSKILNNCSNDKKNLTVHVGDTASDLLCLLQADIGIVLNPSSSLTRVGNHFGVSFIPLFPGIVEKQKISAAGDDSSRWNRLSGVLYTVSSWSEIHAFILGSM
ncbi:bifunctional TH2 protein, mitochondrial [Capsicum annuum]